MKQIFNAVQYLHDKGIVHRDMKPDNVVFATKRRELIKLIDFGLSSTIDRAQNACYLEDSTGTVIYMAPEQAKSKRYSSAVDIWA